LSLREDSGRCEDGRVRLLEPTDPGARTDGVLPDADVEDPAAATSTLL
jgi:hypothetical protein